MGKKVLLSIFGGIALLGLVLMLVGFATGGHMGSVTVRGGQFVYTNRYETVELADAPHWAEGMQVTGGRVYPYNNGNSTSIPTPTDTNSQPLANAPFNKKELREINIDISAGYVVIKPGYEYQLEVDGPLEYSTDFTNGVWSIDAHLSHYDIRDGVRFWWDGRDMTTTFTLTVPEDFDKLSLSLGAGEAHVSGLEVEDLYCGVSAGSVYIQDFEADRADLSVNAGFLRITRAEFDDCSMYCDVGAIEFSGSVEDNLRANCSLGSIVATLPRPENYGWQAEVDLGHISIDNQEFSTGFSSSSSGGNHSAKPYFDLKCGLGSIEIHFTH